MKRKMKHMAGMLALIMSICLLAGCAGRADVPGVPDAGNVTGTAETRPDGDAADSEAGGLEDGECPEGYVYDYQVSMEPIPEEIAALGGPCEGTIHAFPSRIGMALTELEMEKDPVLKAEVEKRIPEIEAALEEEIGGEFVVDGVIILDELAWAFFCTEVLTGYQFDLYYGNNDYYAYIHNSKPIGNIISVDYYYDEKESVILREALEPIVKEIYTDGNVKIRLQNGSMDEVDIVIAQYTDNEIDRCVEQEKVLLLWNKLQLYDNKLIYNLSIAFYPPRYKDVMHEKYNSMFRYDFGEVYSKTFMTCLMEKGEIWCCLNYAEEWFEEDANNLDVLLQKYKDGNYEQGEVWDYWIP